MAAERRPRRHTSTGCLGEEAAAFFRPYPAVVLAGPKGTRYRSHVGAFEITASWEASSFFLLPVAQGCPCPASSGHEAGQGTSGPRGLPGDGWDPPPSSPQLASPRMSLCSQGLCSRAGIRVRKVRQRGKLSGRGAQQDQSFNAMFQKIQVNLRHSMMSKPAKR